MVIDRKYETKNGFKIITHTHDITYKPITHNRYYVKSLQRCYINVLARWHV